jgi:hypothetical protein
MSTKLIELKNGVLIEVDAKTDYAQEIAGGFAEKVNATLDQIEPVLVQICHPVVLAWKELNKDVYIESAEVELSFSFEGEGNIYLAKAKSGANINLKLILKPQSDFKIK